MMEIEAIHVALTVGGVCVQVQDIHGQWRDVGGFGGSAVAHVFRLPEDMKPNKQKCEFCGDPATKTEYFDGVVYVCDACSA